jgi:hypothetical protein
VADPLERPADIGEALSDGLLAVGQAPLGKVDLGVVGEEVEDAGPGRGDAAVVEGLQVLERDRLALLVRHRLLSDRHHAPPSVCVADTLIRARALSSSSARAEVGKDGGPDGVLILKTRTLPRVRPTQEGCP